MCVRNAGRRECSIRDKITIGKESKGEKEAGKWRDRKERITMKKWKKQWSTMRIEKGESKQTAYS